MMADGLLGKCKGCTKHDASANHAKHREREAARRRRYFLLHESGSAEHNRKRRENRRAKAEHYLAKNFQYRHERQARLRKARVEHVSREHLRLLFAAQDGCCRYCRRPLIGEKHLDHRQPLSRGGAHAPDNLCWACPDCNRRKSAKPEREFLAQVSQRRAA